MVKGKLLSFGLNYSYYPDSRLNGCINDTVALGKYFKELYGDNISIQVFTDDVAKAECSGKGILKHMYELAIASYRENLDYAIVTYSGHGCGVRDRDGDEADGQDEALVPSDYKECGVLVDDLLGRVLSQFNPKTRILFLIDACHSATCLDMKYSWEGREKASVENIMSAVEAKVISISGCLDSQVSMDALGVLEPNKFSGAMTSCLVESLRALDAAGRADAFKLVEDLRARLKTKGFEQVPKLCSTYNLAKDGRFLLDP